MEDSLANSWLRASIPIGRTELMDLVYFQESEPSSLELPYMDEFAPLNPSPFLGATTTDHYHSFFGGAYEGFAPEDPSSVSCVTAVKGETSSMSHALELLSIAKDTEPLSTWERHRPLVESLSEEPVHQLPGWTTEHEDQSMEGWLQTSKSRCLPQQQQAGSPSSPKLEVHQIEPWIMVDIPAGSCNSSTIDILSPVTLSPHSQVVRMELAQPTSPLQSSDSSNEVAYAMKQAVARKDRVLLRLKSESLQRDGSATLNAAVDVNADSVAPRVLKKRQASKIQREFFMCNHVQGHKMDLRFLLHKVLQPSDVNNLGRIVISKREAETHLPYLPTKEGVFITMEDFDTREQWTFRYRFWPNSRSRMYLLEHTGGFVRAHRLKKGDILVLWRSISRGTFVWRRFHVGVQATATSSTSSQDRDEVLSDIKDVQGKGRRSLRETRSYRSTRPHHYRWLLCKYDAEQQVILASMELEHSNVDMAIPFLRVDVMDFDWDRVGPD